MTTDITTFLTTWAEAERAGDTATLDQLLTDDFRGVGPLGFILPKPAWLERHEPGSGLSYETFELDEVQTRTHGTTALVTARQNAIGAYFGQPTPESIRATLALVDDGDGWKLATIHMSFIAGTAGSPPLPGPPRMKAEGPTGTVVLSPFIPLRRRLRSGRARSGKPRASAGRSRGAPHGCLAGRRGAARGR
jgi:ketosteroid isomerase-like protein